MKLVGIILATLTSLQTFAQAQEMPWKNPAYETNIPATRAESRPGPNETGWKLWMKHHVRHDVSINPV